MRGGTGTESVMEIQHYSHQHKLTFIGNIEDQTDGDNTISCHLCEEPITAASYNCRDCNFSLHESCAKLTAQIWHRFHRQHRLSLRLAAETSIKCPYPNVSDRSRDHRPHPQLTGHH
ncbi:putative Cysteine/Histidine-rich C1 domain family protein [Tripterygium wilfordii]|uniref:Putative Cysteine/Histidine-rich C1 domain family protein n=1 Tax=Tripterygium wilfordii TaxID=458696 RepID=A0A7J7E218_TRIWF|nr:putative Cysteine/Histidine-rich C1 domain family protein [Tripterygium wilfordii]